MHLKDTQFEPVENPIPAGKPAPAAAGPETVEDDPNGFQKEELADIDPAEFFDPEEFGIRRHYHA